MHTPNSAPSATPSADDAARARELRRAYELIEKNGQPGRATTSVLHQLGLMIAGLIDVPARDCRSCGTRFGLRDNEIEYFRSHGLTLPTRCRACRNRRRQERAPCA
jgi:hypothetical protein